MAATVTKEKESKTSTGLDVPYYVVDAALSPGTELTSAVALQAAEDQAYIDQGTGPDDYSMKRLAYNVFRVVVKYRVAVLTPLTAPATRDANFGFNSPAFRTEHRIYSLGNVQKETDAPDFAGVVGVRDTGAAEAVIDGYDLSLPPETDYVDYYIPAASFTQAYREVVAGLLFRVHDDGAGGTFFGRDPGEVMLVRASARLRTDDDLQLSFGFSTKSNGHRQIGDASTNGRLANPPEGHNLVWPYMTPGLVLAGGQQFHVPIVKYLYEEEVWERGDLNLLLIPGSAL